MVPRSLVPFWTGLFLYHRKQGGFYELKGAAGRITPARTGRNQAK
ncbi:Phenylalanine--tRNA ligase alpha subunit (EC 6.1. 1.20) (Phenylalanyl-tRNA synthetase alpha subunit) [Limosilactobacillus fermentum L930BB]|nr:Phenylalanine--tRNA ligase alpha subunit (EC 6.1. 1.20) (Phenylalanyl-tRNA synthetase alpha subunit) [Limosilactobacillus fermentum L930BB]